MLLYRYMVSCFLGYQLQKKANLHQKNHLQFKAEKYFLALASETH